MGILHNLTHKHAAVSRPDIGVFLICISKFSNRVTNVEFQPDLPDARPHKVPDEETMLRIAMMAESPLEAMAILRAGGGE